MDLAKFSPITEEGNQSMNKESRSYSPVRGSKSQSIQFGFLKLQTVKLANPDYDSNDSRQHRSNITSENQSDRITLETKIMTKEDRLMEKKLDFE